MQHHQRNRPPQLPDNREIMTIRNWQASQHSRSVSCTNSIVEADGVDAPIFQCSHAAYSPGDTNSPAISLPQSAFGSVVSALRLDNADSPQLRFYPPPMRDIIKRAKQLSHCNLASINSFLMCPQFNTKAEEYMNEAIIEHRCCGLVISEGEQYPCFLTLQN